MRDQLVLRRGSDAGFFEGARDDAGATDFAAATGGGGFCAIMTEGKSEKDAGHEVTVAKYPDNIALHGCAMPRP